MLAPKNLPTWPQLMADLHHPSARELARFLDVSERTVYGWKARAHAPRPVLMALFWESSYGRSLADCDLFNTVSVWKNLSESLRLENENLRRRIARLEQIGEFGTANAPAYAVR